MRTRISRWRSAFDTQRVVTVWTQHDNDGHQIGEGEVACPLQQARAALPAWYAWHHLAVGVPG
jgi:hypothetical protein